MIYKRIILSILTAFTLNAGVNAQDGEVIDKVVAVVGDNAILLSDVESQKLQLIQQKIDLGEDPSCYILEDLMFQNLLLHQAEVDSVQVTEDQVRAELENKIRYYKQMLEQYDKTFEEVYGMSEREIRDTYYDMIEKRMRSEAMERQITSAVEVTPEEVRNYFDEIPKDSLPRINSEVTVAQIVVMPEIGEEANAQVKARLDDVREKVLNGEKSFSFYATLYSEDPGSAGKGGKFGCVSRGTFVPEFEATAFQMKPGEVSEPFQTQYGWHIIMLEDRRGETFCGSHILIRPKISEENQRAAKHKLDSLVGLVEDGKISFGDAAEKYSEDEESRYNKGKIYNPNTGSFKWDVADLDRSLVGVINRMEVGDISKPMAMMTRDGKDAIRVVKMVSITEPHIASLKTDYQLIQQAALSQKKARVMREWTANKVKSTYVKMADEFRDCDFQYGWLSNSGNAEAQ